MTAPNIWAKHAFTTRLGGVSAGSYSSLNLGQNLGDLPKFVEENYRRLHKALGVPLESLVCSRQVHGSEIRIVTTEDCGRVFTPSICEADGMITCHQGVSLMIYVADCVPVLLHDPMRGVIGAVHAGWRGTVADAVGAAIRAMHEAFGCQPGEIKAAIGPSIGACCYEVGQEVADMLETTLPGASETCMSPRDNKFMLDLKEANRILLKKAGVLDISVSDECTYCSDSKYWSHRLSGTNRGSQSAIIST